MAKKKPVEPILGRQAKDEYSGLEGKIRGIKILSTGCVHLLIHPKGMDAFKTPLEAQWVDKLAIIGHELFPEVEKPEILGKKVRDTLSGYEGTVTAVIQIEGYDDQLEVQGTTRTQDGIPSPRYTFDSTYAKRLDDQPVKKTGKTGSPAFLGG